MTMPLSWLFHLLTRSRIDASKAQYELTGIRLQYKGLINKILGSYRELHCPEKELCTLCSEIEKLKRSFRTLLCVARPVWSMHLRAWFSTTSSGRLRED